MLCQTLLRQSKETQRQLDFDFLIIRFTKYNNSMSKTGHTVEILIIQTHKNSQVQVSHIPDEIDINTFILYITDHWFIMNIHIFSTSSVACVCTYSLILIFVLLSIAFLGVAAVNHLPPSLPVLCIFCHTSCLQIFSHHIHEPPLCLLPGGSNLSIWGKLTAVCVFLSHFIRFSHTGQFMSFLKIWVMFWGAQAGGFKGLGCYRFTRQECN